MSLTIRKWTNITTETVIVPVSDIINYILKITGTATFNVDYTLEKYVQSSAVLDSTTTLTFADVNPDTITRSKGSWIADEYVAGMTATITGTTSNNVSYLIATVTEKVLTLDAGAAVTAETITDSSGVTIIADIPAASWLTDHTAVDAAGSEFIVLEFAPTAIRFSRSAGTGSADLWLSS